MDFKDPDGLLTFFPDRLQFDGQDATIRFPLDQVVGLDPAGARETFLMVHVNPKNKIAVAYMRYEYGYETGNFQFILAPVEPIAPALKLAEDYTQYVAAVRSGQEQAMVSGSAPAGTAAGTPLTSSPSSSDEKRELARYDAGFLERHSPNSKLNSFKLISGVPGTLIVFDSGLGYVSVAQNPSLKPARQSFLQNGYLKFFLPQTAILGIRDVSVIRNLNTDTNNTFIAEVDLDRNSSFYQQNKALMAESDQDNRLFFTFRNRGSLNQFLNSTPHGSGARDTF
jgi:hypothetical protein